MLLLLALAILLVSGCASGIKTSPATTAATTSAVATASPTSTSSTKPSPSPTTTSQPNPSLKLEDYSGDFFSIKKPAGWNIATGGTCSTFAFCTSDKANPTNQVFYFNEVGPVYLAASQKTIDKNYMDMGGYPVAWYEMPVINPLTPENFLSNFYLVAKTSLAQKFMAGFPELDDIQVVAAADETSPIKGGQTKTIRALFRQNGQLGEGLFYITVAPVIPLTGMPSGGIGYGFCFAGIAAVKSDFTYYQSALTQCLNSLNISQSYISSCLNQQQQQLEGTLKAGQTLSETSDIIMDVWENRSRSEDILTERWSDTILGNSTGL